jgi:hypothetical protein
MRGPLLVQPGCQTRLEIASHVAQGEWPSIRVESWPAWKTLSIETFDKQADGVIEGILNPSLGQDARGAPFLRGLLPAIWLPQRHGCESGSSITSSDDSAT